MGEDSCSRKQFPRGALEGRVRDVAIDPFDDHGFAIESAVRLCGRRDGGRGPVGGEIEAGHCAGLRLRGSVRRRVLGVNRVEDAVARVVRIEDHVDQAHREVALEREPLVHARTPLEAVEVQVRRELLCRLVEDVERAVEVVEEEAPAARLLAHEVDPCELGAGVVARGLRSDRHPHVLGEFQRRPDGRCGLGGGRDRHVALRERPQVVHEAPDLRVRDPPVESRHHRRRHAPLDHAEDLAVGRAVVPGRVGQIGRLLPALLLDDGNHDTGLDRPLCLVAVAARAVEVVGALARRDRRGRRRDGILQGGDATFHLLAEQHTATSHEHEDQQGRRMSGHGYFFVSSL